MLKLTTRLFSLLVLLTSLTFVFGQGRGEVIFAVNREPDMLDLQVGSSRYDLVVAANVYDTYLFLDAEGNFVPWLAEEVTANEDATVYTMRLQPGIVFHDGTPLNAEAVKYNFDRIVDPATASAGAVGDMGSYESTEIIDDLTVRIHFSTPYPGFWYALSDWRAGGPHSPTALQDDAEAFKFAPVGTGPFKVVEWVQRDRIVLEPNLDYAWPRPGTKHTGPAYLDRIIYRIIPEDQSRTVALTTGEINGNLRVPPQDVAGLEGNQDFTLLRATLPGTGVIIVVNGNKPPTNDLAVRQAILHMTSPDQIARIGYFDAWPPHRGSVLSAPNPGFVDLSTMYPYDPERAMQLLDEAGWVPGPDGIRVKDGQRAELLYIGFPSAETTRVLEFMQATLQPLGIGVEIRELDSGAIQDARQVGEHNLAHLTWIFKDAGFLRTLFHSENIGSGWNFTHVADEELDRMLEQGESEPDEAARTEIYNQVQQRVLELGLVIPTVYQEAIVAFRSDVKDVELYPVYGEAPYFYDTYVEGN